MLKGIISYSIKYAWIIVITAILLTLLPLGSLDKVKYDVFPEFASSQIDIQTEAPGLSPEQIELLVTKPIETEINGAPGVKAMRSSSVQGLSVVTLVFEDGGDVNNERQAISERLTALSGKLPQGIAAPTMSALTSSAGDLMSIGVTSKTLSLAELRTLVDWTIKPRLLSIPGIAKIGIFGGVVPQIQIRVDPKKLVRYDLSIEDVTATAQKITAIRGAGFFDIALQRVVIQADSPEGSIEAIKKTALVKTGGDFPVSATIQDVADVVMGTEPVLSSATVMGETGIVMNVWSQYNANTLQTTKAIDNVLSEMSVQLLQKDVKLWPELFRSEKFITVSLNNIKGALQSGAIYVIAVLLLFLFNWRTALISCAAIPLSLIGAAASVHYLGYTLNTMTLGGLAIALGEVVDDAVIGVENTLRRLRHAQKEGRNIQAENTILNATLEVRSAVLYGTLAVGLVFIPILLLPGFVGKLLAPLGISYILAILFSLIVALTVTPALCQLLLSRTKLSHSDPIVVRMFRATYEFILKLVERFYWFVLFAVIALVIYGALLIPKLHTAFLPPFKENHFIAHVETPPGTNIAESLRIGGEITKKLQAFPWMKYVAERIGRAASDDTFGPNSGEFELDLKADAPEDAQSQIRHALEEVPGAEYEVNTFLSERIDETLSGFKAPVVLHIFGDDLDTIAARADEVKDLISKIPGAVDVKIDAPDGAPLFSVKLKPAALLEWGIEPVTALEALSSAFQGIPVGQVYEGNKVTGISLYSVKTADYEDSNEILKNISVKNSSGTYVPITTLVESSETEGRTAINHEQGQRAVTITCDVEGRDLESFIADVKNTINAKTVNSNSATISIDGIGEEQAKTNNALLLTSFVTCVAILLILSIGLENIFNLLLVILNLPLALVGGIIAVYFSGLDLSMGTLVGFVTLFGITLRNSIMMMSHYQTLVSEEGKTWGLETAIQGASERLIPILMTALVAGLGVLPLALHPSAPGHEIEGPMATVILGGLFSSTLLNLLVLPSLALRFGRFKHSS